MAGTSVVQPVENIANLTDTDKAFCCLVASGRSYRTAAVQCGWEPGYGWQKMQVPRIADYVARLAGDESDRIRAGIEADIYMMRRRCAEGDVDDNERATMELRLKLCMSHAKLRGWIVDRKQIDKRTVDLSLVSSAELQSHLGAALDALEPGARQRIEERLAEVKKRRESAGRKPAINTTAERLT